MTSSSKDTGEHDEAVLPSDEMLGEGGNEVGQSEPNQTEAVIRNSAVMAVGTVVSRITGVARNIAITAALGFGILGDTYALGNSLPNIIYILVIGGALNAVFIPQLVRHMKSDDDGGDGYADRLITLVGLILVAVVVIAVVCAPWIVQLYATSDFDDAQLSLGTAFARYCLPQILFYGLYTMFAQVLNSRLHFMAPMFAPIVNNVVMIATALAFIWVVGTSVTAATITPTQVMWLGIGTTLGVAAQALVLIPVLKRVGYRWRPRFDFRGHGLGKAGSLASWTIGLVLVNQVGFVVIARLATEANVIAEQTAGISQGLATYQSAFLVFMLPHSVITISLVTALFPRMSRAAASGNLQEVANDVGEGMRLIAALIVPATFFLVVFGPMIGTVLFGFGQGRGDAATYTGVVVSVFGIALLPFAFFYTLLRGWYAVEDTRTPFIITVIYNVIAIPLTIGIFVVAQPGLQVAALALGYGLSYWIVTGIAWGWLRRRLGGLESRSTLVAVFKMALAAGIATGVVLLIGLAWATLRGSDYSDWYTGITTNQLSSLVALVLGAILMLLGYVVMCRALRVSETSSVIRSLLGRS